MLRETLERYQIAVYAVALVVGVWIGLSHEYFSLQLGKLISPVIAIMLFGMFSQIPFLKLREAFANKSFMVALMGLNFVIVPATVWILSLFLPAYPPLLLGVYLVLLTPCVDYVIVFTHLGRGNARLVLASTPILLMAQMIFLPLYLSLFMGRQVAATMRAGPFVEAFLVLIVLPLSLAFLAEYWAKYRKAGRAVVGAAAWLPVPFMAITLLLVVASQAGKIAEYQQTVIYAVPVFMAFMVVVPFFAVASARLVKLDVPASRSLAFSGGIRNSLVVLPLALALPQEWAVTSAVIVTQTLVELVGALIYIRVIPLIITHPQR